MKSDRHHHDKKTMEVSTQKILVYLKQVYEKLDKMKKDYLKESQATFQNGEELQKQLLNMACWLERTRLYLDNYIYPRDNSLNIIDVAIDEQSERDRRKDMHMTERLYTIVYKDFFTAYERSQLFIQKIQKISTKDVEEQKKA